MLLNSLFFIFIFGILGLIVIYLRVINEFLDNRVSEAIS